MRNVLADLALESEAATVLALRLAGAVDRRRARRSGGWPSRSASTGCASGSRPWSARRWSAWAATATWRSPACPGSTGTPPLNSIWEGSGNVQALDVLRTMRRDPDSLEAFLAEVGARGRRGPPAGRGGRRR